MSFLLDTITRYAELPDARHHVMFLRRCKSVNVACFVDANVLLPIWMLVVQGMVTLALSTWIPGLQPPHEGDTANWVQNLALYGSLYIVALGTGGIKPNVSAFGADQFDMSSPKV